MKFKKFVLVNNITFVCILKNAIYEKCQNDFFWMKFFFDELHPSVEQEMEQFVATSKFIF